MEVLLLKKDIGAWLDNYFWRNAINTFIICFFVVCTSLTIGTLVDMHYLDQVINTPFGYWLLHLYLGQCPNHFSSRVYVTFLNGIFGDLPTTIIVLVAINQPFTLWMLHSFSKIFLKN